MRTCGASVLVDALIASPLSMHKGPEARDPTGRGRYSWMAGGDLLAGTDNRSGEPKRVDQHRFQDFVTPE